MNYAREIVRDAAVGVGVATTPKGLSTIQKPGCAAVIWQREPLPEFQSWIDRLRPEQLPKARIMLRSDMVNDALLKIFDASGLPASEERDLLIDDISAMADIFANVMSALFLRLRLDVISTNACRKFHLDAVTARLICTYRGTGTQYGISADGSEPSRVFTTPTCSPILFRGSLWPERPKSGLLHRSPPIEGTGETRLVLVLDPVVEHDDQPGGRSVH